MSIRYQCVECGSVLKIKDSLAGTSGKCPHCKNVFTVPEKTAETSSDTKLEGDVPKVAKAGKKATAAKPGDQNGEEFDVEAFLLDDSAPGAKKSAGLSSTPPPAAPPTPQKQFDSKGRRVIAAPPPSPGSSAEMPTRDAANSSVNASANARDLLTKTMEDSRLKADAVAQAKKPLFKYDLKATLGQLKQSALLLVLGVVAVITVYWLMDRMLGQRIPLPELAEVSGSVNLDGNPLTGMIVHLTPVNAGGKQGEGSNALRLRDATGVTDENGFYSVEYMNGVSGAPLGKVRIWLEAVNPADFAKIPPEYIKAGSDIREVKAAGNEGRFNLDLKSGG